MSPVVHSKKEKFQRWYEEGYDLSNDPKNISWLHIHHSEVKCLCEVMVDPTKEPQLQQMASVVEGVVHKSGLSKLQPPKTPAKCILLAKISCARAYMHGESTAN